MNENLNISSANNKIPFFSYTCSNLSLSSQNEKRIPFQNIIYINSDYFVLDKNDISFYVTKSGIYQISTHAYSTSVASFMYIAIKTVSNNSPLRLDTDDFPNTYHSFNVNHSIVLNKNTQYKISLYNYTGNKNYQVGVDLRFLTELEN